MTALFLSLVFAVAPSPHGQALLDDVSKKAVKFFWEQSNPKTGLTKDRAANFKDKDEYVVASVAATGFALSAYAIGAERGWIPRQAAIERTRMTLNWLKASAKKDHGWFYHFIDWSTGERMWKSEVSSIDTCLMLAGAIMADQEFNDSKIHRTLQSLLADIDWNWMLHDGGAKANEVTLCMGWHPESGFIRARWNEYYEDTFVFVQMLGLVPKLDADAAWKAIRREVVTYDGYQHITGGPIFMHQMSQGFIDFSGQRDMLGFDYWVEGKNACLANRQFCIDNPNHFKGYGPGFWGLNAGDAPNGYVGNGAPRKDGKAEDNGTISPTGAIASVLFIPEIAKATADSLIDRYPEAYGRYGFSNGIDATKDWKGPDVIGIDLGMVMLAIEGARDHLPHRLSMKSPIYQLGMKRAGFHKTSEGSLDNRPLQKN